MKTPAPPRHFRPALTLLEMTIVLMVLITLTGLGFVSSKKMNEWKLGRAAAETVRSVYTAQRMYLADNPTASVAALTSTQLIPYLPNSSGAMPTVKSLTGATLSILVNVSPPFINAGSGIRYDPSGSFTDSLWDVGE